MTDACVRVALPLPLATDYTYGVAEPLRDLVAVGMRVVVPVRERELIGIVTAIDAERPSMRLRDVLALPDTEPLLDPCHLELARWLAAYYGTPLGLALRAALPAGMWGASQVRLTLVDGAGAEGGLAQAIVQWLEELVAELRQHQLLDQLVTQFPAAAVGKNDFFVIRDRKRTGSG